jgi:hypothetical protein
MVGEETVSMSGQELTRVLCDPERDGQNPAAVGGWRDLGADGTPSMATDLASPGRSRYGVSCIVGGEAVESAIPEKAKIQMLTLDTQRYGDGHTLATEKLAERHGIITQC